MNRILAAIAFVVVGLTTSASPVTVGLVDVCPREGSSGAPQSYVVAACDAGLVPLILPRTFSSVAISNMLNRVDAVVFCGGEDISPELYDEKVTYSASANDTRDRWESLVMAEAVRRKMPILGICRGCQLINVHFGGSLYQDIRKEFSAEIKHGGLATHSIAIAPGSRLAALWKATNVVVNSWHHQGVRRLAKGFRVSARSQDGFVEAIEAENLPIVGLQFHPEQDYVTTKNQQSLEVFRWFPEWIRKNKKGE